MQDIPEGVKVHLPGGWSMPPFGIHQYLAMVIVAVALWILGAFWLGLQASDQWVGSWQDKMTLHVYVQDSQTVSDEQMQQAMDRIKDLPDVVTVERVEALQMQQWLAEWMGSSEGMDELLKALPTTLNVVVTKLQDDFTVTDIRDIAASIGGSMNEEEIQLLKVNDLLDQVEVLAWFVTVMLALAMALIISNTLRMILLARADEVHLMRLLGAQEWFVRMPFVLEGLLLGAAAGAMAWLLLWPVDWIASGWLEGSAIHLNLWVLLLALVPGGASMGALGAVIATASLVSPDSSEAT